MIVAVGLDIIELVRIEKVWNLHRERFLERHYTPEEIAYCLKKGSPLASLAARFAAKEAFQKCWPENHGWRDVWVVTDGMKPRLHFAPHLKEQLKEKRQVAHLSLTHSRDHAAAVVVLEALSR
ncbi:MAG: holo-ACP synthase [Deinococcota bacterium]|jgi:holo-[acyl-carrier protein] synthase|nr:holo-ACP synthase [Deinococcota bacterium]